ncbi:hypothetical protein GCM10007047_14260 [Cerasicoccus arenae]|uniref:Uncharacterized protein n=2 Tax=Cerasicoccus arenae TaxID=424488 RepID=A0A8J3DBJ1_9BACT|nr:hypothetical protein GCM10007047_14260 [Cerasicoccus arenae]
MPSVEIDSVVSYYKPEQAFKRIGEYLGGEEQTGRKIILRTQTSPRKGLYFVVRITEFADELPAGCFFEVDLLRPDKKRPVTKRFDLPANPKSHREIWLGFTGDDQPANDEPPVAWRVRMLGPDGQELSSYQSFLWSKPADDESASTEQ